MLDMNTISLEKVEIVLEPLGFLRMKFKDSEEEVDIQEAKEHMEACLKITKGKKIPVLLDARNGLPPMSEAALSYFAKNELTHLRLAEAILINSLAKRIIARFYFLFHKPNNPLKIFASEKEAIFWLKKFIEV